MKKKLILAALLGAAALFASEFKVNNRVPASGYSANNSSWKYEHNFTFEKGKVPAEFLVPEGRLKKHKKYASIYGYNGDITLQIKAPGPVKALEWSASVTNFADKVKRKLSLSYSLDGVTYKTLDSKEFIQNCSLASGKIQLPANRGYLFLKYQRHVEKNDSNGRYGFVLLQKMNLKLDGTWSDRESISSQTNSTPLKKAFPTGVYWAWERTKMNADYAKMEFWQFVEHSMKVAKENGYDTLWFVNLPGNHEQVKVLALAEKHGLRVLTNSDLYTIYYTGLDSLGQMDRLADQTVARIGHFKSLLGYVLKDEPLLCDMDSSDYLCSLMKKADPGRDSVVVVMNRPSLTYLRDSKLPIVCTDIYYFADENSTMLPAPRNVGQAEFTNALNLFNLSAERHNKHSWFMGQIFGDIWGRHWYKNGKYIVYPGCYLHWRMPTKAESKWQIWEALRLGSKGIIFYVYHSDIPLMVPPEKAVTADDKKKVAAMDKRGKIAASWKTQKLTDKTIELEWSAGMLHPGGKPTEQMVATRSVMKLIRANESLLVDRCRAEFPVFFATDAKTNVERFRSGDKWFGVIVNRDLDNTRTVEIRLPLNVKKIKDLATGKEVKMASAGKYFQKISLTLEAGSGALLESEFYEHAGLRYSKESFDQYSIHNVKVNDHAEIFNHGRYGADENRSLRLKKGGDPSLAACALLGISNPKNSNFTYSKNLSRRGKGTTYCMIRGKLDKSEIRAAVVGQEADAPNFQHLLHPKNGKLEKMDSKTIQKDQFYIPAVVPREIAALEFYLGREDYLEEIILWFVPDPPGK
ncbi:MAG: hypothetical protein IKB25_02045 [Lentisphaeria bacterium]|nr:hypothetical protein [Lentisphaeria bacterium]